MACCRLGIASSVGCSAPLRRTGTHVCPYNLHYSMSQFDLVIAAYIAVTYGLIGSHKLGFELSVAA
jgi:hypothetical protein